MKYCRDLPPTIRRTILRDNINVPELLAPYQLKGHSWYVFDTTEIVSDSGISWLESLGIHLSPVVALFKLDKSFTGPIHIDAAPQKFAFNFVMSGTGAMQWVDVNGETSDRSASVADYTSTMYKTFNNPESITIIESWQGSDGLVRVDVPHRMIGGNEDRYAISIRPKNTCNYTFDEVTALIGL